MVEPLRPDTALPIEPLVPLSRSLMPLLQPDTAPFQLMSVPAHARFEPQVAVVPPPLPVQLQLYGPEPVTAVGEPVAHKLLAGALVVWPPFEVPHTPLTVGTQLVPVSDMVPLLHEPVALPWKPPAVLVMAIPPWPCEPVANAEQLPQVTVPEHAL